MRTKTRWIAAAVVTALCSGLVLATPAAARHPAAPEPLADGLAGPLSVDVTLGGDVLVAQNFAGLVSKVSRRGGVTDLVQEPGVTAVDGFFGFVYYTVLTEDGSSQLKVRDPRGRTRTIADLGAHEASRNPDADQSYGVRDISEECAAQWPVDELGPPQYTGIVESNPYSIEVTFWGTYVADAAANAILRVDHWTGRVRTVAVLPPQPLRIPDDPTGLGLPACAGGLTYDFEPVPTDVEYHRGDLYVSTLPGGPEDPSLGARGSVYRVDPRRGSSHRVATGFLAATDLAVAPHGTIYVTELFGGQVSKVTRNGPVPVASFDTPVAIEWARGRLYVAYEAFGSGKVATIRA